LRHPVSKVVLIPTAKEVGKRADSLKGILLDDLNTREFEVHETDVMAQFTRLTVKPDYKVLGPKIKGKMKQLVAALSSGDTVKLRDDLADGKATVKVDGDTVELVPGDVEFEESLPDHLSQAECRIGKVYVDVTRTKELEAEGLVRDVTRRVQVMRKELDLKVEQKIEMQLQFSDDNSVELVGMFEEYLSTETRAENLSLFGPKEKPNWKAFKHVKDWEIDDLKLKVGMTPK
jgi:isoleucyl-tRNA synthetase